MRAVPNRAIHWIGSRWIWLLSLGLIAWSCTAGFSLHAADEAASDSERRRLIVGTWEDDYQGHRIMTVRPDGSATMIVQLHGWKAALYAAELRFEMIWSIEQGRLKKQTTSGQPAGKVKLILKMMGDRVDEQILELTADRLWLLDENGQRKYDWHRVPPKP